MSEHEFEAYLNLLARTLRLSDKQRDRIAGELRDHMEQRLDELMDAGLTRHDAALKALDEFGDANVLAHELSDSARLKQRRRLMQTTFATASVAAVVTLGVMYLAPSNYQGQPSQPLASAQDATGELREPAGNITPAPDADGQPKGSLLQIADAEQPGMGGGYGDNAGMGMGYGMDGGMGMGMGMDATPGRGRNTGRASIRGGMGMGGGFANAEPAIPVDQLNVYVIDCQDALPHSAVTSFGDFGGRGGATGNLNERTAQLGHTIEQTVQRLLPHGKEQLSIQPFEAFLIVTATEEAILKTRDVLDQIERHVHEREAERHARAQDEQRHVFEMVQERLRLATQEQEQQRAMLHDEVRELEARAAELSMIEELRLQELREQLNLRSDAITKLQQELLQMELNNARGR